MPDLDFDLDRALAPLLERPLADPEPVAELEGRAARARRRRLTTRLGVVATAAAVALVAVALLPRSADQVVRTIPPADAPPEPSPPGPQGEPSRPRPIRDARTVHRGAVSGEEWELRTGFDDEGRPCVELRQEMGGRRLCGNEFYPWRPFEQASATVGGTELRFGTAAPSVARIRLVLQSEAQIDATIIEVPGYPVKAWFTSIPKGDRVRIVVPIDANGLPAGGG